MKTRMIKPIVVLSALTAVSSAHAQDATKPARKEAVAEARSDARLEAQAAKPEKPARPEIDRAEIKDSVEEIKTNFRAKAQEYVRKQKEIIAQRKTAKGEEKAKVPEKLKDLKDEWKEDRPDVRDLVSDLKEKVEKEKDKGKGKGGGKPRG